MAFKVKDHFFNKAKKEGKLARSFFKLEEIHKKYKLFKKEQKVLDLGYYPGSWTQYILSLNFEGIEIHGVDLQGPSKNFDQCKNVHLYKNDFTKINELSYFSLESAFDIVVSDMAPKTTGVKTVDQLGSLNLLEDIWGKLPFFLKQGGHVIVKVFEGGEFQKFYKSECKKLFNEVALLRPNATRSTSKEIFLILRDRK